MCEPGKNFPVGHPSQISPGQARLTSEFFGDRLPEKKLQLVGISILLILLSLGPRCHMLTPLRDRRPRRSILSQERPLLATSCTSSASSPCAMSVRPVPTVPVPLPCVQCQRRIPDARALTRHAPVHMPVASAPPRAGAHARALTPVRACETARVGSDTIL